ncbi:MAG: hypothetical protein EXS31_09265 [Pedosphaera sp.]|nr:hypothetical protein [Pedosphaera sp.]
MNMKIRTSVYFLSLLMVLTATAAGTKTKPVKHSFLATGGETRLISEDGQVTWRYDLSTRDGWVLKNENILLAVSKGKEFPGGGVVEVDQRGRTHFKWTGSQEEVNTVQMLDKNRLLVTEAGPKPRILEIDRAGKTLIEVPIQCQLTNFHMQSRMTRKLANGNYLVPQLFDKVVREYDAQGRIAWEAKTPNWPFTAIRLPNGNTLVGCTYGNLVVEFNPKAEIVWQVSNDDFPEKPFKDACGVQRLPNGNTMVTSYGAKPGETRLTEITRDKKIVWTYTDTRPSSIHHFQILSTNGKKVKRAAMR